MDPAPTKDVDPAADGASPVIEAVDAEEAADAEAGGTEPAPTRDADPAATGSSGSTDNCTWSFNESTGVLTINGSGAMDLDGYWAMNTFGSTNVKEIVIGSGVTSISNYVFYSCTKLEKVTLSDTVKSIGSYAFEFCMSLKSITFPSSMERIYTGVFYGCTDLSSVKLNDGLKTVDKYPFPNTALTEITIPASVTSIGEHAFGYTYEKSTYTPRALPSSA